MCSTPAPPSAALVAAWIGSGVGEVNTAPGTAASSMPTPTNPACNGSCPLPPPLTSPTFPEIAPPARETNRVSGSWLMVTRSACAVTNPATLSATTWWGSLINFFMTAPSHTSPAARAENDRWAPTVDLPRRSGQGRGQTPLLNRDPADRAAWRATPSGTRQQVGPQQVGPPGPGRTPPHRSRRCPPLTLGSEDVARTGCRPAPHRSRALVIEFDRICKRFPDGTEAVREISLTVPSRRTTVLVGSSGSGKTTLLRM